MIDEITKFLNKYDMDVRKSHDARFMDQKCTPDVVCFIADCLINLNPQGEFTNSRCVGYAVLHQECISNIRQA